MNNRRDAAKDREEKKEVERRKVWNRPPCEHCAAVMNCTKECVSFKCWVEWGV